MSRPDHFLIEEVLNGPRGEHIAAFFDMDRTLIYGFSVQDVFVEQITTGQMSLDGIVDQVAQAVRFSQGKIDFSEMVTRAARSMRGQLDEKNYEFGRQVFEKRIAARIYPEARDLLAAHRKMGHRIIIVSAATPYQVAPVAQDLEVDAFLCTYLEVENGICTGKIIDPPCYGEGKSIAVRNYVEDMAVNLADSYFYSDGHEDLPLLELVGNPRPLNPDKKLTEVARAREWPINNFEGRGRTSTETVVRTSLAYLSIAPAAIAALSSYALNRRPREARNLFQSLWGEMSSASIGLRLEVEGEEYLWSERPAVFMANHQSAVDPIVMMKLLRQDVASIAKKEVKSQPVIGQIATAMGTVFVDRMDNKSARKALEPTVDALKSGTSIMIFPEGTRSPTNKLARFKKGGFHIAIQAGVPIIPIVLKNTTDALPKSAVFARPATVEVKVLPPVFTNDWDVKDIDRHIQDVKDMFLKELGQVDGGPQAVKGASPVHASRSAKSVHQPKPAPIVGIAAKARRRKKAAAT